MTTDRKLTRRGRLLLIILSPIVAFGLLEVALRIGGFRYEPWRAHLEGKTYDELKQREIYEPHPELIWTLRPSTVLNVHGLGFIGMKTNSHGLRGRDLPGPRGPDEFRVLAMGDSVTFGLGLPDGQAWPDRMEQALRAAPALSGKTVRVVNAGVPGWSSVQGMRNLERIADYDPDVIVFWYGLADSHEMYDLPDSAQTMPVADVPRVLARLWALRVFQLVQKVVTGIRRVSAEGTRVSAAEYRANVERLMEMERSGGPRVIFVHEPERCGKTLKQLEFVVARAEAVHAEYVFAPQRVLSWIAPAPDGMDLRGRRIIHEGRPALVISADPRFPGCEEVDIGDRLEAVRDVVDTLRDLKKNFDRIVACLPAGKLGYRDLFGAAPPAEIFADNCHLTPRGAWIAGGALAQEALERTRDRRR